jgi:hypothetical protein
LAYYINDSASSFNRRHDQHQSFSQSFHNHTPCHHAAITAQAEELTASNITTSDDQAIPHREQLK